MVTKEFLHLLRGPFSFLRLDQKEIERIMPRASEILPEPHRIFLEAENATPLVGFAVLQNPRVQELRESLANYIHAEEKVQTAQLRGALFDARNYNLCWSHYKDLLTEAAENCMRSTHGLRNSSIFWLVHSLAISRLFKEMPRSLLRLDLSLARGYSDQLKYRVFHSFLHKLLELSYEIAQNIAAEANDEERNIFPAILEVMRDNVLIFTEDHISHDLAELKGYFRAYLRIDEADFLSRLSAVTEWHREQIDRDPQFVAAKILLKIDPLEDPDGLLRHPGYMTFLAKLDSYDSSRLLTPELVKMWENLLLRLKEYELLLGLRRVVIPVQKSEGRMTCQRPRTKSSEIGGGEVTLSSSTRALDFMTPWVVDPLVWRYGLIYDITQFSAIIAQLERSPSIHQDNSYRQIYRFQRWVNLTANTRRLKLEKYLGDGALYSGRHPSQPLAMALRLQEFYRQAVEAGFPFNRGLRIALNYGPYRLLPIEEGATNGTQRYEFFGHGIVELSRLVSGKSMHNLDETKTLLLNLGYSVSEVDRFFAPVASRNADLIDADEQERPFPAFIDSNGSLINEGIVLTENFIQQLEDEVEITRLMRIRDGNRRYLALELTQGNDELLVGMRRLGSPSFKGIGSIAVYEAINAEAWRDQTPNFIPAESLIEPLTREAFQDEEATSVQAHKGD
jgi:hypothetical protein